MVVMANHRQSESQPLTKAPGDSFACDFTRTPSGRFEEPLVELESFVNGPDGAVLGRIVGTARPPEGQLCWYCANSGRNDELYDELYQPCNCPSVIHRSCFRKWRQGWINPRNYFACPNCLYSYNIERVRPSTVESTQRILRRYRLKVAQVWLSVLLMLTGVVALIATIAYYADRSEKNIPVGVKWALSSVVSGFPSTNSTSLWREEFKSPDHFVWPYYTLLGMFTASVIILSLFGLYGCSFNENERRTNCTCCQDCCNGCGVVYIYDPCPTCNTCGSPSCDCKSCDRCPSGGGGGDNDAMVVVLLVVVLVIVVIVIFSALVVVIAFCIQRMSVLYDRLGSMLRHQQYELEGETVVLGMNESWRPNAVV